MSNDCETNVSRRKRAFDDMISYRTIASPVGTLVATASDGFLVGVSWQQLFRQQICDGALQCSAANNSVLDDAERQLEQYFTQQRKTFDLPLKFRGSPFQCLVWRALMRIPYGQTRTYKEIAVDAGSPASARAVGMANAKNPIAIIAPCHRVIGSDGKLTGFAGGLEAKQRLLALEGWSALSNRTQVLCLTQ